jgi:hypothetical protein
MTMPDELSRLTPRTGKADSINHIVQPAFKKLHQSIASHSLLALRFEEKAAKLAFPEPVGIANLLLLTKLDTVF